MMIDYNECILNLIKAIEKHYGKDISIGDYDSYVFDLLKDKKNIGILLLDGFGNNIYELYKDENYFLKDYFYKKTNTVFPPTTVAATNAIITGKYPNETCYLGWQQYFSEVNTNIVMFKNTDNYDFTHVVDINVSNILPIKTFYQNYKNSQEFYPAFKTNGAKTFEEIMAKTINHMNSEESFSYTYWDNPDYLMHEFGIDNYEIANCILEINRVLENKVKELKKEAILFVIADHGHINVEHIYLIDFPDFLATLERLPSLEVRCAAFKVKKNKEKEFIDLYNKYFSNWFTLYSKDEVITKKLFGKGDNHQDFERFIDDYLLVAKDKYCLSYKKDDFVMKGHHAGMTKAEMEIPIFIIQNNR